MWVREQYTDVLFTENWSNVAATVHVPYMNSSRKWEKTREKKKKKKKRKTQQTGNAGNAGNANPNASIIYKKIKFINRIGIRVSFFYFILETNTLKVKGDGNISHISLPFILIFLEEINFLICTRGRL